MLEFMFVIENDCGEDPRKVSAFAQALDIQLKRDLSPEWCGASLGSVTVLAPGQKPKPNEIVIWLMKTMDQAGAEAYHDRNEFGVPCIKACPALDAQEGQDWSVSVSHEVAETVADALLNTCIQDPATGRIYALEIADAVERDTYEIQVPGYGGVKVSNFCTRAYFSPPENWKGTRLDFLGLVTYPFEIRDGGYCQWLTPEGWHQEINGAMRPYRAVARSRRNARLHPFPGTTS